MTPWFAAGAGFVLAAGLWIYSPHTELRFPSANAPDEVPCTTVQCGTGGGQPATSVPSKRIVHQVGHQPTGNADVAGRQSAASGLTFAFTVAWQQKNGFQALITVRGKHLPATWRLEFTMPGTHIRYVLGAQWQALSAGDGGIAFASQQPGQGGHGYGYGDGQGNGGDGQGPGPQGINLLVMGSGSPRAPATCVFNGSSCTFK